MPEIDRFDGSGSTACQSQMALYRLNTLDQPRKLLFQPRMVWGIFVWRLVSPIDFAHISLVEPEETLCHLVIYLGKLQELFTRMIET